MTFEASAETNNLSGDHVCAQGACINAVEPATINDGVKTSLRESESRSQVQPEKTSKRERARAEQAAEKAAQRERIKAEQAAAKAAQRERIKAEQAAERERAKAETAAEKAAQRERAKAEQAAERERAKAEQAAEKAAQRERAKAEQAAERERAKAEQAAEKAAHRERTKAEQAAEKAAQRERARAEQAAEKAAQRERARAEQAAEKAAQRERAKAEQAAEKAAQRERTKAEQEAGRKAPASGTLSGANGLPAPAGFAGDESRTGSGEGKSKGRTGSGEGSSEGKSKGRTGSGEGSSEGKSEGSTNAAQVGRKGAAKMAQQDRIEARGEKAAGKDGKGRGRRRGLSLEEKGHVLEHFMAKAEGIYTMKELEKVGPTLGVIPQSVKDVVLGLTKEKRLRCEKIGSSNVYWVFKHDLATSRKREAVQLTHSIAKLSREHAEVTRRITTAKDGITAGDDGIISDTMPSTVAHTTPGFAAQTVGSLALADRVEEASGGGGEDTARTIAALRTRVAELRFETWTLRSIPHDLPARTAQAAEAVTRLLDLNPRPEAIHLYP